MAHSLQVNVTKFIDINGLPGFLQQLVEVWGAAASGAGAGGQFSVYADTEIFDFDEVADQLLEQGLQASPSQLHGCLCGLLAAGAAAVPEAGLAALNEALDLDLHGELAGQVMQLYQVTARALQDEEFDFYPLLPGDDTDLVDRTLAMSRWCQGFLAGYAQAGAKAGRQLPPPAGDSQEILRDFAAIAQAGVDEESDEEESENSYAELVEYIRFAALNACMDAIAGEADNESGCGQGPSPH